MLREELLNAFFDAASLANVGLNILDDQLRFLRINQALAEINGAPVEAHIGKTVKEILPQIAPTLLPLLQQVLLTGKPIVNQFENRYRTYPESGKSEKLKPQMNTDEHR